MLKTGPESTGITLTADLIALGGTRRNGFTRSQLAALGVPWPPPGGWKQRLVGRWVSRERFEAFMAAGAAPVMTRETLAGPTEPAVSTRSGCEFRHPAGEEVDGLVRG